MVRYARGAAGKAKRQHATAAPTTFTRENPFKDFPQGKTQFDQWEPLQVDGPAKVLIIGDLHIPYHDRGALLAAIKYGKDNGADTILLNGDVSDFFSISFWEKDPRQRRFAEELKTVCGFLEALRSQFPKARIIYKLGNHEERYERYMRVKAPELLDVPQFEFASILNLAKYGIELVGDKRPIKLGELNTIHGHEFRFAIANPVSPARGLFLKAKAYALCNHFHQSSYHTGRTIEQHVLACWSLGCLCDLHPEYMPMNEWCHGLGFTEIFKDGKFNMIHRVIKNEKVC